MVSFTVIIKGIPLDVTRWEALWEWAEPPQERQTVYGLMPQKKATFTNVPDTGRLYIAFYIDGGIPETTTSPNYSTAPYTDKVEDGAVYKATFGKVGWSQVKASLLPIILAGAFIGLVAWIKRKR